VRIRSDRRHSFGRSPDELWAAIERVDRYREWWPWLRRFDAHGLARGEVWTATVQPPLPYRLTFELDLVEVVAPNIVAADVTGDIEGSARIVIAESATGADLHVQSDLTPTSRVLRSVATLASPVARYGHQWVLDTGLRQFRDRALD
jgi:hypothetical protein